MTLGTVFGSVLGPSATALHLGRATGGHSHKVLAQRDGGGSDYYHHGSFKKPKGKSKSEKKHAILSALTLLAFLFFLSVLQSCIREQYLNGGPSMMFAPTGPTAPTGHQSKDGNPVRSPAATENSLRHKRAATPEDVRNGTRNGRKSRTLLGIEDEDDEASTNRRTKFIRNFSEVNNWTRELSQVSEKDLEDQKLKTSNFPLYWKNNRFQSTEMTRAPATPATAQSQSSRNRTAPPALRRFKKRERTSAGPETVRFEGTTPAQVAGTQTPVWNYKNLPERLQAPRYPPEGQKNRYFDRTQNGTWQAKKEAVSAGSPRPATATTTTTAKTAPLPSHATTPRNRRSEYVGSTVGPADYDDYERYGEATREDPQLPPTPAVGLDLNTFQTFPVYNYYNHRREPEPHSRGENQTADAPHSEPTEEIDRMHNEVRMTTPLPLFHPTRTSPSYSKPSHPYEKVKHRTRHPSNHLLLQHHHHHHHRNRHPIESRYRYSPYRKAGSHEPHFHDHLHDDYVVVAKYPQDEEPGFDFVKFFWTMLASFARPLTNLVPSFAKDNREEPQCYDLLVCEAQRVSAYMGPTAEALATTVGTLLTWAATEDNRQVIVDAINAGRENTCQQQIRDCEGRSGGKSAMTVIAQVMEMRLR